MTIKTTEFLDFCKIDLSPHSFEDPSGRILWKNGQFKKLQLSEDDIIKYYLEHPDERDEIANKCYESVRKHHTYYNRMKDRLDFIKTNWE